jgi:hypothetical protein
VVRLRDHGRLVNLSDQRWILKFQDVANVLELRLIFVELVPDELVSKDYMLLDGIHLTEFELQRKLF